MLNREAVTTKDDGTNILLDANENAYGPGLALSKDGKLPGAAVNRASDSASAIDVDLLGLNRYPDPYDSYCNGPQSKANHFALHGKAIKEISSKTFALSATPTTTHPKTFLQTTSLSASAQTRRSMPFFVLSAFQAKIKSLHVLPHMACIACQRRSTTYH